MDRCVLVTWMLTLIFLTSISTVNAYESIAGKRQPCTNEGEEVAVDSINKDFYCFKCRCQNGFVECDPEQCPSVDDCYMLVKKPAGVCCEKCKECFYRGKTYASGAEWSDPEDPCSSFKCMAGVVTESNIQCYTPCSDPLPPKPGQCCPTCIGCTLNGQRVDEGREVTLREDPCLKCQCNGKRLTCMKKACPVLQCPVSKQVKLPGECCPRCTERREIRQFPGKCILGKGFHTDKKKFEADPCSPCICTNGTSICRRTTCPVLECPPEMQYQEPDSCCPTCPPPTMELHSVCTHNGTVYQDGDTWDLNPCAACRCHHGTARCTQTKCPEVKCRPNQTLVTPPGQCCAKCEDTAGICTVFGDPHYKTFDGKFFSFQGSCKYQLTSDCTDHTFSIRVTNDARSTKASSWTKTVTLKMGETKVNLGQKMRVKVNGTRVLPPYDLQGILSVNMTEDGVVVDTALGIRLLWDGANFLQVQAAVKYKDRLCGLCGNYNGISRDDLMTRRGDNMSLEQVWRFANSWRVGGRKACGRRRETPSRQRGVCRSRRRWGVCKPLKDSAVFGSCGSHVNPSNYFESCRKDMCECPTELCYCDSFAAYAHECSRLGVELPNWRQETKCTRANIRSANAKSLPPQQLELIQRHKKRTKKPHVSRVDELRKHIPKAVLTHQHKPADRTPPPLH
ncbi:BMP-binding endothelial regulator protein [Lutzomyia longipalpis]|uniref:Putative von willebrand factor n=1 Tax=Lutzomyia longipalpis TaxID=7200 RepID=A0A1B0CU16_LUTLO|nr:BMP-binding endothelial regulator protein [Lutzomyia longipalpis]